MIVQKSIEINAPPEKVWPFLIEPENVLKWAFTFKKFEYTSEQHSGVGTTVYVEEKAGGPLIKINFRVTEWVENQKLAFSMTSANAVKKYEVNESIEAIPVGSRFTFREEFQLPWGFIGRLIESVGQRTANVHLNEYVAGLKNLVEAQD